VNIMSENFLIPEGCIPESYIPKSTSKEVNKMIVDEVVYECPKCGYNKTLLIDPLTEERKRKIKNIILKCPLCNEELKCIRIERKTIMLFNLSIEGKVISTFDGINRLNIFLDTLVNKGFNGEINVYGFNGKIAKILITKDGQILFARKDK